MLAAALLLLFVSNEESGDVSVIDTASDTVVQTIPVGKRPRGIQASPDRKRVYVALSGSPAAGPGVDESKLPPPNRKLDGIGVIDADQKKLVGVLDGGTDPEQFAVSQGGKDEKSERLYIANEDTATVSVLDPRTGKSEHVIRVGREPEGVAIRPDGLFTYVTSEEDNLISVIDVRKQKVVEKIQVGLRPRAIAFLPDSSRAYITCEASGEIAVVDSQKHKLLKKISLKDVSPGILPMGIVLDPPRNRAYITGGRSGKLVMIDTERDLVLASLDVGKRPWGIQLSADGSKIYTANGPSNDITVVSTSPFRIVRKIEVGKKPWGIARIQ